MADPMTIPSTEDATQPVTASSAPSRNSRLLDDDMANSRRIAQFMLHNSRHELWTGDTLVLINFPARPGHGRAPSDCSGIAWSSIQVRVSSEKLKATNSTKFASLLREFGLRASQKAQKAGLNLYDLQGVKYFMDLTPDDEGDEIVFQMTEMSLTPGITHWWNATHKHGVEEDVAGGHDDVCTCWTEAAESSSWRPFSDYCVARSAPDDGAPGSVAVYTLRHAGAAAKLAKMKSEQKTEAASYPSFRNIPDYCPIRHRVNILRLLFLIEGKRISIDSAPRMWTLVAVAKIFDCTFIMVPWVRGWLSGRANCHFIEVLPEETLQLAMTMKFVDVTKCAFRILVNELALELAAEPSVSGGKMAASRVTVFGRRKRDTSDDQKNVIEHAAQALVDRLSSLLDMLSSVDVFEHLQIQEWSWLMRIKALFQSLKSETKCTTILESLNALENMMLTHWKNGLVTWAIAHLPDEPISGWDDDRALYVEPADFLTFNYIYSTLEARQKMLLPLFFQNFTQRWQEGPFLHPHFRVATGFQDFERAARVFNNNLNVWRKNNDWLDIPALEVLMYEQTNFNLTKFDTQVSVALTPLVLTQWAHEGISPSLTLSRHLLLNLTENELKFLPLWAGGNDDGTGGVFEDRVPPPAFMGPVGPGPSFHTGYSIPSDTSSCAASISSDLRGLDIQSTVGPASLDVQDSSASTIYDRRRVVADDVSVHSEAFTDDSNAYQNARFEIPADNQSISAAMENMVMDESGPSGGTVSQTENEWEGLDTEEWETGSDDTLSAIDWTEADEPSQPTQVTDSALSLVDPGKKEAKNEGDAGNTTIQKAPGAAKSDDSDDDMVLL